MSLPTITVIGNLKRIETKVLQSGKQLTKFQVECSEKNAKGEWTNLYIAGEVWDKASVFVSQYFDEGSLAIVTGKMFTNVYEKADGSKVYENKLMFPNVSFAPKDKSGNQNQGYQQANNNQQAEQQNYAQQAMPSAIPAIDINEDEIPF